MNENNQRRNRLRYRLNYRIRKDGFILLTKQKTVYWECGKPMPENKYLNRLVEEFGYAIQYKIN